jgi:hypothetical protein
MMGLLLLALCSTALAGSASPAQVPVSVVAAQPVSVDPGVLGPFPLDGAFVYEADPVCLGSGVGSILPNLTTAICMRAKAIEYIRKETQSGRIVPGPGFKACSYPSDPNWPNCVAFALAKVTPEIRFGVTPKYVNGSIGGAPYSGCAAGISFERYIRVSIADLPRSYRLVSWEAANGTLAYTLDLYTSADGPIVAAATAYAAAQCGVQ